MGKVIDLASTRQRRALLPDAATIRWRVAGDNKTAHRRKPGGYVAACGAGAIAALAHPSFRRCRDCWPQEP